MRTKRKREQRGRGKHTVLLLEIIAAHVSEVKNVAGNGNASANTTKTPIHLGQLESHTAAKR